MTDYQTYVLKADCDPYATAAFLPHSGQWPTYTIGKDKYSHVSSWGGQWDTARSLGYTAPPSTHARIIMQELAPKSEQRGLRPQWRAACHMAWTPGPMSIYKRGECEVTGIDIKGAFLRSMKRGLPIWESWRALGPQGFKLRDIERFDTSTSWGLVDCTVNVPEVTAPGLTAKNILGKPITPIGDFRYVFPIDVLNYNVKYRGVTVVEIHGAQICECSPWLANAAEHFEALPKFVRKHLYTRAYGLWGSIGGYRGQREPTRRDVKYHRLAKSTMVWRDETLMLSAGAGNMYRPDVSCAIAANTTVRMLQVMDELEKGGYRLIASHVDCIWYSKWGPKQQVYCPPDFADKHSGHGVFIAPGLYTVGDDCGRAGVGSNADAQQIRDMPRGNVPGRYWELRRNTTGSYWVTRPMPARGIPMQAPLAYERGVWNDTGWLRDSGRDISMADL